MKKIVLIFCILLILFPLIVLGQEGDLTPEEISNMKKDIAAGVRWRERFAHNLIWLTKGKEILFLLPYLESDSDPQMRAVIAEGLGKYGDASIAIPALLKAREDSSWFVRSNVAESLLLRGEEKEAAQVLIGLIKEGTVYYELRQNIYYMKNAEAKEIIKNAMLNIINDSQISVIRRAYAISLYVYAFNEPLTSSYKEKIIEALKTAETISTETYEKRREKALMSDAIGALLPDRKIAREDYLEIAALAAQSKDKYIKQAGDSRFKLLENLK